jgi:hypothetical protein
MVKSSIASPIVNLWLVGSVGVGCIGASACNVSSPPELTGGVRFDSGASPSAEGGAEAGVPDDSGVDGAESSTNDSATAPEGAVASGDAAGPVACEKAVVVVTSDYLSTNVAVSALDGTTLSGSFVSSGATKPGLALALNGDVDVPLVAPSSGRVLIIDRYGSNVLTWMNLADATVVAQLPVGTGFESNPQDYMDVGTNRAYVTRLGTNPNPGAAPFDQGGDVLLVDTAAPAITGRIAIPEENPALTPCPEAMTWLGSEVVVTLGRFSPDFSQMDDGRFVGISPARDAIDWTVNVTGLQNCGRLAVSPSGKTAAIACSSHQDVTTSRYVPAQSDVVIYDVTQAPPKELRRLGLGVKLGAGIQQGITFATEDAIVAMTYGGNATPGDTVFSVSAATGEVSALGASTKPYVFGGLHCAPGCGDICLLCDAERSKLRRFQVQAGALIPLDDVTVDTVVGLPPRVIGGLR